MKKFSRTLILSFAITSCLGFLAFPITSALAQSASGGAVDSVVPPTVTPIPGGYTYLGTGYNSDASLNPILNSMNLTLNAKLGDLGQYLHGNENMGNGLIELLMSINQKVDKNGAIASEGIKTTNALDNSRVYLQGSINDAINRGVSLDGQSVHNEEMSCADATYASGLSAANAGTSYAAGAINQALMQNLTANATTVSRAGSQLAIHANYCTQADITAKVPECVNQSVKTMPNADRNVSSLYLGAVAEGQSTNGSLDAQQQQAAMAYINNIVPAPPEDAPSSVKDTPSGRLYEVHRNSYIGVASAVTDTLGNGVALHAASGSGDSAVKGVPYSSVNMAGLTAAGYGSNGSANWSSTQTLWKQVFGPNYVWPKAPSEWDVLNFDVFSRYANKDWQTQVASFTEQQSLQEMVRMTALNSRLRLMEVQELQRNNRLLALLLAQHLNPTTAASLKAEQNSLQPVAQ